MSLIQIRISPQKNLTSQMDIYFTRYPHGKPNQDPKMVLLRYWKQTNMIQIPHYLLRVISVKGRGIPVNCHNSCNFCSFFAEMKETSKGN